LIGADVGYIRVGSFAGDLVTQLREQAAALEKSGAKHLVVDIRRTAEGPLEAGLDAARLFVKSGTLAVKAGRGDKAARETIVARDGDGAITLPVTLLVTTGTAGAAEIFAAALDGNKRADLIGERTLGRAGVQKLVRLADGRGLWLTYARYLTPGGDAIQGRGLNPDVAIDEPEAVEIGEAPPAGDPILDAAIERVHKIAA
jgi:carboxyl-terminal processing protease